MSLLSLVNTRAHRVHAPHVPPIAKHLVVRASISWPNKYICSIPCDPNCFHFQLARLRLVTANIKSMLDSFLCIFVVHASQSQDFLSDPSDVGKIANKQFS